MRRVVRIAGRIESHVDEVLQPLYREWADGVAADCRDDPRGARVPSSCICPRARHRQQLADRALDAAVREVVGAIGADVYSTDGRTLEQVVGDLLVERGLRIAAAESCTGGLITSRLTDVPGSSRYVDQSVITYSNDAKTELLGVPPELLERARRRQRAGRAGHGRRRRDPVRAPTSASASRGSPDRPAARPRSRSAWSSSRRSRRSERRCRTFRFYGEREHVKFQASQAALDMVRRLLVPA